MEKQLRKLYLPIFIFCCFFVTAGYLNRYASDDFEFLSKYRDLGFTGSVAYFYHNWNTRWLAIGWLNLVNAISAKAGTLVWYHALAFVLLWTGFYRLYSALTKLSAQTLVVVSGFSVICFFYSCFSATEVFFWINASAFYLFGCIAFIFALSELVKTKHSFLGHMLLLCSAMYIGGAYEPLVFSSMMAGAGYLFYKFRTEGHSVVQHPPVLKTIVFLSVLMIAFAISYAGEGHAIRAAYLPQTTIDFKLWVLVKALVKIFILFLPVKLLTAGLFSLPWFLIAMWKPFTPINGNLVLKAAFVFLMLVFISLAPLAFVMSEMGPERAWTQISLYVTLFAALTAAWLGSKLGSRFSSVKVLWLTTIMSSFFIVAGGMLNIGKDIVYSRAYDSRMNLLEAYKRTGGTGIITLEPLPETGWLRTAEISTEPDHFTNQQLKKYLQLSFEIKKADEALNGE